MDLGKTLRGAKGEGKHRGPCGGEATAFVPDELSHPPRSTNRPQRLKYTPGDAAPDPSTRRESYSPQTADHILAHNGNDFTLIQKVIMLPRPLSPTTLFIRWGILEWEAGLSSESWAFSRVVNPLTSSGWAG